MYGQSIFGLSSLHSLYSLKSKRFYFWWFNEEKPAQFFVAEMIWWQLELHIPIHCVALASFWGQKYIDSWDLTSEAVFRSPEATFQIVLKWFLFHFHTGLMSKWPRKGLHELSKSLTSETNMEAVKAGLSKWLDFKNYA